MTRLDTILSILSAVLFLCIGVLLFLGEHTPPKITHFSLEEARISAKTGQLSITFSREMDKKSVEEALKTDPVIEGNISWSGKRMVLTFDQPLSYNTSYHVGIEGAKDRTGMSITPYKSYFVTRAPELSYIGTEGEEFRKLILWEKSTNRKEILPTGDLLVLEQFPHPSGSYLFFFAVTEPQTKKSPFITEYQELYSYHLETKEVKKIASNEGWRNHSISLSFDGTLLLLKRQNIDAQRKVGGEEELFLSSFPDISWKPFWNTKASSPAFFAPDGLSLLAWTPREGYALMGLSEMGGNPEVVGHFEQAFGFSPDGSKALFTSFEEEGVSRDMNHLTVFMNKGEKVPLLKGLGTLASPKFSHEGRFVYYLLMKKEVNTLGAPLFHLYAYDFDKSRIRQITDDHTYSEEAFSLSPDGKDLVFERYPFMSEENLGIDKRTLLEQSTNSFAGAELWIYDTESVGAYKNTGLVGRSPKWIE